MAGVLAAEQLGLLATHVYLWKTRYSPTLKSLGKASQKQYQRQVEEGEVLLQETANLKSRIQPSFRFFLPQLARDNAHMAGAMLIGSTALLTAAMLPQSNMLSV